MADKRPASVGAQPQGAVDVKREMDVIAGMLELMGTIPLDAQQRAHSYVGNVLGLTVRGAVAPPAAEIGNGSDDMARPVMRAGNGISYPSLAELYNAADPKTGWEKVLVGGYWFQICEGHEQFGAQAVNDGLKEIGAKVANVTVAFNRLQQANPRLVLQVKKSGKGAQARKLYRLTTAGIAAVETMLREGT